VDYFNNMTELVNYYSLHDLIHIISEKKFAKRQKFREPNDFRQVEETQGLKVIGLVVLASSKQNT